MPGRLSHLFRGALEPYASILRFEEAGGGDAGPAGERHRRPSSGLVPVPARELLRAEGLERIVAPFRARYPESDGRAVLSLWSQWYFGYLVVPSVTLLLGSGRLLPLGPERVDVLVDPEEGRPAGFRLPRLPHGGRRADPEPDPFERFRPLVRHHLEPVVGALARHGELAERLLWSNAGTSFDWTVRQLEADADGGRAAAGRRLLESRAWPDGWRNPLFRPVRIREGEDGTSVRRRRICCLRYLVGGVAPCGEVCPLPVRDSKDRASRA